MRIPRSALIAILLTVMFADQGNAQDQTPGPSVYLPVVHSTPDNRILITLVDQTPVRKLPVTIVLRTSDEIIWAVTRTYETRDKFIYSLQVVTGVQYRISWLTRPGDYCTIYVATFEPDDHLSIFSGQCTN